MKRDRTLRSSHSARHCSAEGLPWGMVIAGNLMLVCDQRCIPETDTTHRERNAITWHPR